MKKLIPFLILSMLLVACQPPAEAPRYTTSSPEIDHAKAGMEAYFAGDWETLRSRFADTAHIYHNSMEPMTPDENISSSQELLEGISSYSLGEETFWEMIIDDDNQKWVYFWGEWNGVHAATGTDLSVPFHLAWHYEDGLVTEEYGLWDTGPFIMATLEAQAAEEASEDEEM